MTIKVDSVLIHRGLILGNLKALLYSQNKFAAISKGEPYTAGYLEGYQDAIFAVAQMVQVEQELLDSLAALGPNILTLYQNSEPDNER